MSNAEAYDVLERLWKQRHLDVGSVLQSRQCANCMKVKLEAIEAELSALAAALDCLRNTAAGGVR